jgi:hypothetical protein
VAAWLVGVDAMIISSLESYAMLYRLGWLDQDSCCLILSMIKCLPVKVERDNICVSIIYNIRY